MPRQGHAMHPNSRPLDPARMENRRPHLVLLAVGALALSGATGCGVVSKVDDALFRKKYEGHYPDGQLEKTGELYHGEQTGLWTYYYRSGDKRAEGTWTNDKQKGQWTYWYKTGQQEMEGTFSDQRRRGAWSYWHPNGRLRARGTFDDGREAGAWSFWSQDAGSDAAPERGGFFDHGRVAGLWSYTRPDGSRRAEGYHYDGVKVGRWRFWEPSGAISERLFDLPEGVDFVRDTWDNGSVRREGFRKNGEPDGLWVVRHRNGNLRAVGSFHGGRPDGQWSLHDGDGELIAIGPARSGRPAGEWTIRGAQGERTWSPESIRPPSIDDPNWSSVDILASYDTEDVVEIWLGEIASPLGGAETATPGGDESSGATRPSDAEVASLGEVAELPIRAQPWTVREENGIDTYVENYSASALAGTMSSGRYGPPARRGERRGDTERSSRLLGRRLPYTRFDGPNGQRVDLADLEGRENVLLVVLRGFAGEVCVYCAAQTKALADSFETFEELGTEVFVVYPGPASGLDAFVEAYELTFGGEPPPYRLLYDRELGLTEALGLQGDLAIPSTLLLDKRGTVRFAYVGRDIEDRPPTRDLLRAIRDLDQ